jgi:hypothetical protein
MTAVSEIDGGRNLTGRPTGLSLLTADQFIEELHLAGPAAYLHIATRPAEDLKENFKRLGPDRVAVPKPASPPVQSAEPAPAVAPTRSESRPKVEPLPPSRYKSRDVCLMCPAHDALLAERDYGKGVVDRYRRSAGPGARASGPILERG